MKEQREPLIEPGPELVPPSHEIVLNASRLPELEAKWDECHGILSQPMKETVRIERAVQEVDKLRARYTVFVLEALAAAERILPWDVQETLCTEPDFDHRLFREACKAVSTANGSLVRIAS